MMLVAYLVKIQVGTSDKYIQYEHAVGTKDTGVVTGGCMWVLLLNLCRLEVSSRGAVYTLVGRGLVGYVGSFVLDISALFR